MTTETAVTTQEIEAAQATIAKLATRLKAAIKGREDVIELITVGLLADGHVLLEDYPGSGKTTLARALGESIVEDSGTSEFAPFRRIQFTPDLLPSDITGTSVFSPETGSFSFRPGPLFSHIVLADEINRTSPKVQAALLEAMAEKQVTSDNATHKLDDLFFVIATQNPLDVAGTYPLPTPQLDRFLFKIAMKHIARDAELELLAQYPVPPLSNASSHPPVTRSEILAARRAVRHGVLLAPPMRQALVDFARALRADPRVLQGASTRSIMLAMPALQARALGRGRTWTSPEDLDALVPHVFRHRVELSPGVDDADAILRECLAPILDVLAKESMRR